MSDQMLMRAPAPLPVREIIAKSYAYAWENRSALILPVALLLLLDLFSAWLSLKAAAADEQVRSQLLVPTLVSIWFFLVGTMAFAVGLHRRILRGEARQDFALFQLDRNLLAYLWTMLKVALALPVIFLVLIVPIAIFVGVSSAVTGQQPTPESLLPAVLVAFFIAFLFWMRLMPALPGAAVGEGHSIRRSWKLSDGNWGRLIFILFGVALPFQLPTLTIQEFDAGEISWAAIILTAILTTVSLPVLTVALSLSYGKLTEARQR